MARRPVVESADEESDHGEGGSNNTSNNARAGGSTTKVKDEVKPKLEGRRRQQQQEEPAQRARQNGVNGHAEEEDAEGEEEEEEGRQTSPRGSKRQRVNGAGDARSTTGTGGPAAGPSGATQEDVPIRMKTLPRDVDGYIPGSIVRIQLKNFVTYDYVEFRPGPYLNMIIGPNGTGKSSIACAIALGLNFPPKILGRASELNSFVKHGAKGISYIEIELKGPAGKANSIVRRTLSATDKKSSFTLNGAPATGKEINTRMMELNVQVENLCSFLPQDKVSSFAAMTSQQLLVETQKAAGDPNLTNWFENLKEEGKNEMQLKQRLKDDTDSCNQMKERNELIQQDVERLQEREKVQEEIDFYEIIVPCARYREKRQEYALAKKEQKRIGKKVKKMKLKNAPAHNKLREFDEEVQESGDKRKQLKEAMTRTVRNMKSRQDENDRLEKASEALVDQLDNLKKTEKDRVNKIKAKQEDIASLEERLKATPPDVGAMEDLQEEMRHVNLQRNGVKLEFSNLNHELRTALEKKVMAERNVDHARQQLQALESPDAKKLALLQRWDKDTHDAVVWLRQNRNLFKMEVFEPAVLSCAVKDPRYASLVEACLGGPNMKFFVGQCDEDIATLNKHINDASSGGRKMKIATWYRDIKPERVPPPPMSYEELKQLGFDGYALDYLEYPPGMESFLKENQLHRTPIALNEVDLKRATEVIGRHGGGSYGSGKIMSSVTKSKYGLQALTNNTRPVQQARNFIHPPVDKIEQDRIQKLIDGYMAEREEALARKSELTPQLDACDARDKEFKAAIDEIKAKQATISQFRTTMQGYRTRLERAQRDLQGYLDAPPVSADRARIKAELWKNAQARVEIAKKCLAAAKQIFAEQKKCTVAGFTLLQTMANRDDLKAQCDLKDEKYTHALTHYNQVNGVYEELKILSTQYLNDVSAIIEVAPPEMKQRVKKFEDGYNHHQAALKEALAKGHPPPSGEGVDLRSYEELDDELTALRYRLDMITHANPGVLKEFEKRKLDIEAKENSIAQLEKNIESSARKIKSNRDKWQPALERLVASIGKRFSAAFDRIGCAGEIRIKEDEDYEKWAIEIYVKFRDTEKLQLLTNQRQSGGERSLTTIMYLMSLTEEARAPFSLVDEINQGMDQRAERVVHNSMVDVTCKEDSAQYFLITPKLLTDLKYHERMKILCVNNGEWLPEDPSRLGNMMNMIDGFVAHRTNSRAH